MVEELVAKGVQVEFIKECLTFKGTPEPFQKLQLQILGAVLERLR